MLEILFQRFLTAEKIHSHPAQVINQKVGLGREMQLAAQVVRVQPAGHKLVEVTVAADQCLGLHVAGPHVGAAQVGVGRVSPLQRVTHKGKLETALAVFGKLLLIPVIRQMPRPTAIKKRRAHAAAGAFWHMDKHAFVSLERGIKGGHPRQGFVHRLTVNHRQTPQQKHPLVLGKHFPEQTLQHSITHARRLALSFVIRIEKANITNDRQRIIWLWSSL